MFPECLAAEGREGRVVFGSKLLFPGLGFPALELCVEMNHQILVIHVFICFENFLSSFTRVGLDRPVYPHFSFPPSLICLRVLVLDFPLLISGGHVVLVVPCHVSAIFTL